MLSENDTVLVVVDVQGKLARLMYKKDNLFRNIRTLIQGVKLFEIPVIWMEQTPDKLGPTVEEISQVLGDNDRIIKSTFSCCDNNDFNLQLKNTGRKNVLICGIETHVCVYQTAVDLISKGYYVEVVLDAVSSRFKYNKKIGLEKIVAAGGQKTSTETALFELQKRVDGDRFHQLIRLIK